MGSLRSIIEFTEIGIKEGIKEEKRGGNIYRDILFKTWGFEPPKYDKKHVKEVRKKLKKLKSKCELIEKLPRTKKTLAELSENMSIPREDLEEYIRRAEKDKVIEKTNDNYQLTIKGVEITYASFSIKEHNLGKYFTLDI